MGTRYQVWILDKAVGMLNINVAVGAVTGGKNEKEKN